jgi:hypothetical protein
MLARVRILRNDREPAPLKGMPSGRPAARWLTGPLLAGLRLLATAARQNFDRPARTIQEVHLVGARSPAPTSLILLLDESGSFTKYEDTSRKALEDIKVWSTTNLRSDDAITVICFAGSAGLTMNTTSVADIPAGRAKLEAPDIDDRGTAIQPALRMALNSTPPGLPRSLVVLTDTAIDDADPDAINQLVRDLQTTSMSLIIPHGVSVTPEWSQAFPYEKIIRIPGGSADQVALAIAKAAAHATGQKLEKR